MKTKCILTWFFAMFLTIGCKEQDSKPLPYYNESEIESTLEETLVDSSADEDYDDVGCITYDDAMDEVRVPFTEQGGVKLVPVKVNGLMTVDMILDSGCSGTLISSAEARFLYDKGYLTDDDFLGVTQSQIADGSIVDNMVVVLRELVIGDQIRCTDVVATVSENAQAPLLLGNEVLNRAPSYVVDNQNKVIIFKLQ